MTKAAKTKKLVRGVDWHAYAWKHAADCGCLGKTEDGIIGRLRWWGVFSRTDEKDSGPCPSCKDEGGKWVRVKFIEIPE